VVSVPMSLPLARAHDAWQTFMLALTAVFAAIGVVLNAMLWWMVIRPVTKLARIADQVSLGALEAPAFQAAGRDEIGALAQSFTRMRRSLSQALDMLGAEPA
jgi:HAMP domain-containing protein